MSTPDPERDDDIARTARRIRTWLVQSYRYSASTIELDDILIREMDGVVQRRLMQAWLAQKPKGSVVSGERG